MKIILNKEILNKILKNVNILGFVPTMGAIHEGHISLIRKSIKYNKKTIVSIFVNRPQFNKKNDFDSYPRILKKDFKILRKLKVDYVFVPTEKQIYPDGLNKKIRINSFKRRLCGKFRPGHFEAVVDVIDRFIKIIRPDKIYLGNKDMQQLILINDYVIKNKIKTKIIGCKTIRQKNGIACSSRNQLLNSYSQEISSKIYKLLRLKKRDLVTKKISINSIRSKILKLGVKKIEYIKILDINKIIKPFKKLKNRKIFISYYLDSVRLIDNI